MAGKAVFTVQLDEYRFYEDGPLATSTALGTQSVALTRNVDSNSILQIRVQVQEVGGIDGLTTDDYQLQYNKNSEAPGGYVDVNASSSDVKVVNGNPADGDDVTGSRLTGGAGSFVTGGYDEGDGLVDNRQLTAGNYTEHVLTIELQAADLTNGDDIFFRILLNGATFDTYNVTPQVIVEKAVSFIPQVRTY